MHEGGVVTEGESNNAWWYSYEKLTRRVNIRIGVRETLKKRLVFKK